MRFLLILLFFTGLYADTIYTMRGGKFEGTLLIIDKDVVVVKTTQGQKELRRTNVSCIMLTEPFHSPSAESKTSAMTVKKDKPLIIMRDGTRIRANVIGSSKKWIDLETDYGKARYERDEVMYVDTNQRAEMGYIDLDAKTQWIKTPIVIKYGDRIEITTMGSIKLDPHADEEVVEAGGQYDGVSRELPVPAAWHGAVIGKIGDKGSPFLIAGYFKTLYKGQEPNRTPLPWNK